MLSMMPYRVWREWLAYHAIEPFDETRADLRIAQLDALVANAWFGRNKRWSPEDFLFNFKTGKAAPESDAHRAERLLALAKDLTVIFGGEIIDGSSH